MQTSCRQQTNRIQGLLQLNCMNDVINWYKVQDLWQSKFPQTRTMLDQRGVRVTSVGIYTWGIRHNCVVCMCKVYDKRGRLSGFSRTNRVNANFYHPPVRSAGPTQFWPGKVHVKMNEYNPVKPKLKPTTCSCYFTWTTCLVAVLAFTCSLFSRIKCVLFDFYSRRVISGPNEGKHFYASSEIVFIDGQLFDRRGVSLH